MPPTSIYPTALFDGLDTFLEGLVQPDKEILSGVASVGDPAAYALVWEWGNVRQTKPGPKTVLGTNPDGRMVWLSMQAPFGYIRVNEGMYWKIVQQVMSEVNFNQPSARAIHKELENAAKKIARAWTEVTQYTVPVDSGDLRDSLKPVFPGDAILKSETDEYETLIVGEE